MKECSQCHKEFPSHLIDQLVSFEGGLKTSFDSCPICALAFTNKMHGIERTDFTGSMASLMLAEAKEFIKKEGE